MARIFSIEFFYNDAPYRALITVRKTPFHTEYKITLQANDLDHLLLSDKIVSPQPGTFVFANVPVQEYNELMKQILIAVADHTHLLQL
jgi:hypothetical protein